eukprot:jgi/Mesen1/5456/ME000273S04703
MGDPTRKLSEYISAVSAAVNDQDGTSLAELLELSRDSTSPAWVATALTGMKDMNRLQQKVDRTGLGDMLVPHMQSMMAYHNHKYADAYNDLQQSANAFLQELRNWDSTWAMPTLYTLVFDLRQVAEKADAELAAQGKTADKLKGAASFLMKLFGVIAGKGVKRVGALYVACQLFKVYFKVTYKYYTGRLDVFNDTFAAADEKLTHALSRCQRSKVGNIRRILKYLIPVKLSLGVVPNERMLRTYNLPEYEGVVRAVRTGDVRLLRHSLLAHEDQFLRAGVYLVLEKLELQVYRRLFKKMHLIQKKEDPSKAHQLRMSSIVRALKWLDVDMDTEEVECITATMIYKSLIKGYFSHKSKVVVLSKQDAFPRLTARAAGS